MINKDRIVPIQKVDFLSMVGIMLKIAEVDFDVLPAESIDGQFSVKTTGAHLANQPVKTLNFDGATSAIVYFVADYGFEGFKVNGEAVAPTGDTINPDGVALYKASLTNGAVAITAITPVVSE